MAGHYERHRPEDTILHRVVREHLGEFLRACREETGVPLPRFVERAFRAYLACGLPSAGFTRLRCAGCGHEQILAFSCKTRLLCPSCAARHTADGAARRIRAWGPRRLVGGERQGGLCPFAMAEAEGYLDAAAERIGLRLGRRSFDILAERQSTALEHRPQPARDPVCERRDLVQRGRWRGSELELSVDRMLRPTASARQPAKPASSLLVPGPISYQQVKVRMDVEAPSSPLQDRQPAHAGRAAAAPSLPTDHRVVDQPYRRIEHRRPEGEQPTDLERQADHDLAIGHLWQASSPRTSNGRLATRRAARGSP